MLYNYIQNEGQKKFLSNEKLICKPQPQIRPKNKNDKPKKIKMKKRGKIRRKSKRGQK